MTSLSKKIGRAAFVPTVFFVFAAVVNAQFADLVVVNADVRTIDEKQPRAEALAAVDGRFTLVGTNADARKLIGSETKLIDAGGKLVFPGFNDSHVHLTNIGLQFFSLDLKTARSAADSLEKIRYQARFLPKGEWILGGGWNASNVPSLEQLDAAAPDHPVFLYGRDPKYAVANSLAFRISGIKEPQFPVERGQLVRIQSFAPKSPNRLAVLETALNYAAANGVTSVQDVSSDDLSADLAELERRGKLRTRVYDCVGIDKPLPKIDRDPEKLIRGGCLKHYSEGESAEIGALTPKLAAADRAGVQLLMHAIGPSANKNVLTIFGRIVAKNGQRDRRLRVEHAYNFRRADLERFAQIPAIASMQPSLFFNSSPAYFKAFGDLRNSGALLAFGSDAAMIDIDPIAGILASTGPGGLTIDEAVSAYTLGSAYAEFQENDKGSIAVGKLADFVVLSQHIFETDRARTGQTKIVRTVLGGRTTYERPESER